MTTLTATGQVLADRYRLNRWLGGGSMAEVWEATDVRMDLVVAVKVLRPAHVTDPVAIERFRIEAKLGAGLDHPGIARVHDVNVDTRNGEPPWMVQEFVAGVPLSELLIETGPLSPGRAAAIVAQAAEAAHAAHTMGVIHRDLTPRNLLIGTGDLVKVTDFGIARTDSLARLTVAGQVVGTPAYLSPEQVRGKTATGASDVYTLAVVLYECLAGRRPFDGGNAIEVARAHVDQTPPSLPTSVPGPIRAVVANALAKEPENRPSSDQFARRLRAATGVAPRAAPVVDNTTRVHPLPDLNRLRGPAAVPRLPDPAGGLAGVRQRLRPVVRQTSSLTRRLARAVRTGWDTAAPDVVRVATLVWRRARQMRIGWVGAIIVLIAVVAVLSSG